jgi:23S rRNA pseudouridine1911/1915/1917 synthase
MTVNKYILIIDQETAKQRLDCVVTALNEEWSRSQVKSWIAQGKVKVNDIVCKAGYLLKIGDKLLIEPSIINLRVEPEKIALNVVYEDNELIVINKARGMVVHIGPGHTNGTLVNALLAHTKGALSNLSGELRPGIVHRLDKETSGLLIVAKNNTTHHFLAKQLANRTLTRKYIGIVHGVVTHDLGIIDAPIGRNPAQRKQMAVVTTGGKEAITRFKVLERFNAAMTLECTLTTGRTHQIRVHLKHIKLPIIGDNVYAPRKNTYGMIGQALHAYELQLIHPVSKEKLIFNAKLPKDMLCLIEYLRGALN